jgi:hypothetical protein
MFKLVVTRIGMRFINTKFEYNKSSDVRVNVTFHVGQCAMDSLTDKVSGRREERGFVSTFMHCTDVGRIRDIAKGIAI